MYITASSMQHSGVAHCGVCGIDEFRVCDRQVSRGGCCVVCALHRACIERGGGGGGGFLPHTSFQVFQNVPPSARIGPRVANSTALSLVLCSNLARFAAYMMSTLTWWVVGRLLWDETCNDFRCSAVASHHREGD